jgi:putative SOS response-associated peptidase YedK
VAVTSGSLTSRRSRNTSQSRSVAAGLRSLLERGPQTFQPIVRLNRDIGEREIVLMRWGLVRYWGERPRSMQGGVG